MDIDEEKAAKPMTRRERLAIRLVMLLVGMVWPAKYEHQIKDYLEKVEQELSQ